MESQLPLPAHEIQANRSDTDPSLVKIPTPKSTFNPLANPLVIGPGKAIRYEWPISTQEHQELVAILGPEYERGPVLRSTYVGNPQELCRNCGTPSTFSDMVRIALRDGVHTTDFMIQGIRHNTPGKGEEHKSDCKNCGEMYDGSNNWSTQMTWGNIDTELCGQGSG